MKNRIQGIIIGALLTALLLGAIPAIAGAERVTAELTYGVRVQLHGEMVNFDHDSRPFIIDGRTFLPLRTLAELIDLPVDFDAARNTVILGRRTAEPLRTSLNSAAPAFDRSYYAFTPATGWTTRPSSGTENTVSMGGTVYHDVNVYSSGQRWGTVQRNYPVTLFTLHNLNAQYSWLTGYVGRVDGSGQRNATMNVIGDGRLLHSIELSATALPTPISIFVEGIRHMKIEFVFPHCSSPHAVYAFAGFVE
jgi:type II secretory pathway pseudopilin PulG